MGKPRRDAGSNMDKEVCDAGGSRSWADGKGEGSEKTVQARTKERCSARSYTELSCGLYMD